MEFHIPAPLLAHIASLVSEGGVEDLKNWIRAGPEGKDAALSRETLSRVRLDKSEHFIWWTMPHSTYNKFFQKCLKHNNPYAIFAEMSRGIAYERLVKSCYRQGQWLLSYKHFTPPRQYFEGQETVGYLLQSPTTRHSIIGRPRCARCMRPGHNISNCTHIIDLN